MKSGAKSTIPFEKDVRASKDEIQNYLNTLVEEYRTITRVDLPELCERFPLWAYPFRVVAGITRSRVYIFITRDGEPTESIVEIHDAAKFLKLEQVMDAFRSHLQEVAAILGIRTAISHLVKEAKQGQFSDDIARSDALNLVKTHYELLETSGQVEPQRFSETMPPPYLPPVSFLENHIESSELKNRIALMLENAQEEIMISAWLDTSLLEILQRKSKEGVLIRIITKKPENGSPQPVKTAYRKLVDFAKVKRNELRHFRLIICDHKEVLVSSSDLTTHSLSQNYEAGIWTSSPIVVERAIELFERVWKHQETKDVNQELLRKRQR